MSEQNRGCLDKMSEVNFSPAESLVCKLVTEIKDHAKNFPNTPRIIGKWSFSYTVEPVLSG